MEYNTQREELVMSEYGRNLQNLVEFACTIEDKEKRTEAAHYIVNVMSNIIPQTKEQTDYKHKLWDYLYYISDFKINVEGPFSPPAQKTEIPRPDTLEYKNKDIQFRFYGRNLEAMILKAGEIEDEEEKEVASRSIANHMKKMYLTWNKEGVSDDMIIQHMALLSNGKLVLDISDKSLIHASELIIKKENPKTKQTSKKGKQQRNYKRNKFSRNNPRKR
jgi:Domain of unknown function (DUF4290)